MTEHRPNGIDIGAGSRARKGSGGPAVDAGAPRPENDPSPASDAEPPEERTLEERREAFQKLMRAKSAGEEAQERRKAVDGDTYTREDDEEDGEEEDEGDKDDVVDESDSDEDGESDSAEDDEDEDDEEEEHGRRADKGAKAEKESGRDRASRDAQESNRLNKAIRLCNANGIPPEVTRQMSKKALIETTRALRAIIRQRDDLQRERAALGRPNPEQESTSSAPRAQEAQALPDVDDLSGAFDRTKFDDTTLGAMRGYSSKVLGQIDKRVQPLHDAATRMTAALNEIFFEGARQRLAVRYSQLDNDKVASQFERKVSRALASGDYSEYRTLTAKIRAAAEDVAGRMFPSGKDAPVVPRSMRHGRVETKSRAAARRGGDSLERRREAYRLMTQGGLPPHEARRVAGVDES